MINGSQPRRKQLNDDLNGDIMVLISKPRMLDPLRTGVSSSSVDSCFIDLSYNPEESKKQHINNRNSFNYPPDLKTMQRMIEEGSLHNNIA